MRKFILILIGLFTGTASAYFDNLDYKDLYYKELAKRENKQLSFIKNQNVYKNIFYCWCAYCLYSLVRMRYKNGSVSKSFILETLIECGLLYKITKDLDLLVTNVQRQMEDADE